MTIKQLAAVAALGLGLGLVTPGVAAANPFDGGYNAGCERVAWGFLGLTQKRTICDGPRRPDGSWERGRRVWTPGGNVSASSYCSGGTYYSSCNYTPGYYRQESTQEQVFYIVFDENVPAGEPGWLPPGTANLIS